MYKKFLIFALLVMVACQPIAPIDINESKIVVDPTEQISIVEEMIVEEIIVQEEKDHSMPAFQTLDKATSLIGDEYAGYFWGGENFWIPGIITYESQFMEFPLVFSGYALPYDIGVMEATAKWRGLSLNDVVDGVALPMCSQVGSLVWLKRPYHSWEGPFKVVDCGQANDIYGQLLSRNEAVEIGYKTAEKWGMPYRWEDFSGTMQTGWYQRMVADVIVSFLPPECFSENMDTYITDINQWFLDRVRFQEFSGSFEARKFYEDNPNILYKNIGGQPYWRIPGFNDGQSIAFDITIPECSVLVDD